MRHVFFLLIISSFFLNSETKAQTATAPSGSGTINDPFLIGSLANLRWIATSNFVEVWSDNKYFKQIANIDASETSNAAIWARGWVPIGSYSDNTTNNDVSNDTRAFLGFYDGGNYEIRNLTINDQTNTKANAGLFGQLGNNNIYGNSAPIISNVRLTNVNIRVVKNKVGALAGQLYRGLIINCSSTGTLTSTTSVLGGLVGQCRGPGRIMASYSTCTVTSTSNTIGVLVALNQGTIIESFSNGSAIGSESIGGLVGGNSSKIYSSYSNSVVSSSTGTSTTIGLLVGNNNQSSSQIEGSFWNSDLGSTFPGVGDNNMINNSTAKTNAQLKDRNSLPSSGVYTWDFAGATIDGSRDVWSFGSDGFPTVSLGSNYWKGSSTVWSETGNWSKNVLPNITSFDTNYNNIVILPGSLSNYPTLSANEAMSSLTLASGSSINLSSYNLTVSNLLTNNGTINTASTGQVIVSSSGSLLGTGTLPSTTINGTHGPGMSPGVQTISGVLTYNAGSNINWEMISNAIGTRGIDYDGIDVIGNLNFAGATSLNLIFNGFGSDVDWSNGFWANSYLGVNGWKLFEVSGTALNLDNVTVTLSSAAADVQGDILSTVRVLMPYTFRLTQVGTGIYLIYTINTSWTGTTSTDWSTASNWNPSSVPTSITNVYIPSGLSNYPVLSTGVSISELTMEAGSSLDLATFDLAITGDLFNSGAISGTGVLELNGSSLQEISGSGTVHDIKINNSSGGVAIGTGSTNKMYVTGVYTPTSGLLTTNGNLIFRSTSSQEGVVGTAGTCPTEPISGDVTVEKYIPAKRAFRFLTPGVTSSTTINANWQEGSSISTTAGYPFAGGTSQNPTSGYGTHITGVGGAANGFDVSLANSPSIFTFDASSYAWVAEANTHGAGNILQRGEAYRLFVRGDRGVNLNTDLETPTATTLRTTGVLKVCESMTFTTTSPVVPLSSAASRFSFIGNPYRSVVDWHLVSKTNVEENLYYWDPTVSGSNGRGAYVTYNQATVSNNMVGSAVDRYIQPGQAFFVRNKADVGVSVIPSVTFDASDIVGVSPSHTSIFGTRDQAVAGEAVLGTEEVLTSGIEKIHVSLFIKNKMGSGPADGFLVAYGRGFSDNYGREDAMKFSNPDENISALYKGNRQSILGLASVASNVVKSDTIPISLSNLYTGAYVLKVSIDKHVRPEREMFVLNRVNGQHYRVDPEKGLDLEFSAALGEKTKDDLALVVNSRAVVAPIALSKELVVYPNPTVNGVMGLLVPLSAEPSDAFGRQARVEIRTVNHRLVIKTQVALDERGSSTVNIASLSAGMYVVRVEVGNKTFTAKLVKQ
jgi:hypothetical protein